MFLNSLRVLRKCDFCLASPITPWLPLLPLFFNKEGKKREEENQENGRGLSWKTMGSSWRNHCSIIIIPVVGKNTTPSLPTPHPPSIQV